MIETSRLLLRPHRIDDFGGYSALWTQAPKRDDAPNAQPLGEEETWARLLRMIGHWTIFGYGPFVVFDRMSGDIIGEAGFARYKRGNGPAFDGVPEALWRIDHRRHGEGFATEAMQAVAPWFDARQELVRTVAMIDLTNLASRRLAERLGFRAFANAIYRGNPVLLFERAGTRYQRDGRTGLPRGGV